MYKVRTHAASNTKAKVILGKLLKDADYEKLIKMDSVGEVTSYLKSQTHYKDMDWGTGDDTQNFEVLMKKHFFNAYEKFFHFYVDAYREFIKAMFCRYEVENLKLFIRALTRKESLSHIIDHLIYSHLYSNIDYDALEKVENIEEFMLAIKDTQYYQPLSVFLDEDPVQMNFHMEMVLDRGYFNRLLEAIKNLKKRDKEMMLDLLGINVDILNVQWIYRGRHFFNISSEELFNFTLNSGKVYDYKALKALCYMDLDAYREFISSGDYADIFSDKEYMMERAMEKHLYYVLDDFTKHAENSIAWPVVLLFKFEYEIRDLFTIIEAKKYDMENIHELLIRDLGGRDSWQ